MTIAAMGGECPYCKRTDPLNDFIEDGKKIASLEAEVKELREALERISNGVAYYMLGDVLMTREQMQDIARQALASASG